MGACTTKPKTTVSSLFMIALPDFCYVCRERNLLLDIKALSVKEANLNEKFKIFNDSFIGYSENLIYILSGTKENNKKTKKCFEIISKTKVAAFINKLPKIFNNGQVIVHKNDIYLINTDRLEILCNSILEKN